MRTPTGFRELADRFRFLEHGYLTAQRIARAVDPGIVMIAAHDPLIGAIASRQTRDDVARRNHLPIKFELHVNAPGTGTEVIGDRKSATPVGGRDRTAEMAQPRPGIAVRNRGQRDVRGSVDL